MKNIAHEFLWIAFPKGFAGVGAILLNFVILGCLGTEAMGAYSLCMAGILLADGVFGSAFDVAVLKLATLARKSDPDKSYNLERSAFLLKLAMVLCASLVVFCFSRPISLLFFHNDSSINLIMSGCLAAVGLLSMRSIQAHLQIDQRFAEYGGLDFAHSCLRFGGIGLVLWLLPPNPTALILVVASAALIVFFVSATTIGQKMFHSAPGLGKASWELTEFVRWSLLTSGIGTLGRQVDVFLLSSRTDLAEVGIFSGGMIFSVIPDMFGMYLCVILSPRIMRYLQEGTFFQFFRRVQQALLVGAVVALVFGLLGVEFVRQYLLPSQYERSAYVLAILWPGSLAVMVSFPLAITFIMFVRPTFLFKLELIILPLTVIFYLVAIDRYGAIGAAWVTTISRLLKSIIIGVVAWRLARNTSLTNVTDTLSDKS